MKKIILSSFFTVMLISTSAQVYVPISVTTPPVPVVDAGADIVVNPGSQVILMATVNGGTPPFTYHWSPGQQLSDSTVLTPVVTAIVTTTFTLNVVDANGCEGLDEVVITVSPVGIPSPLLSSHISVFPNPASGILYVSGLPDGTSRLEADVHNLLGKRVLTANPLIKQGNAELNISTLRPGLYLIRLKINDLWIVKKVTIL